MFCVYCGGKLVENNCSKCNTRFLRKKTFTITSDKKSNSKELHCYYCGRIVQLIRNNRPEEISGICTCGKPARINKYCEEDNIFI